MTPVRSLVLAALLLPTGCAARAEPLEADVVVVAAGPGSPVTEGTRCLLRMQPAFRQGVNCQVLLRCGEEDLFGGARIGGYARCDYADDAFLTALDGEPRTDGDPALDVDLGLRTIVWRGPHEGESVTLALDGATRAGPTWEN